MIKNLNNKNGVGIYIHIPFCSFACHYCDFVKTSNFDQNLVDAYFKALSASLLSWLEVLKSNNSNFFVDTVYFGGGTPGLFSKEYFKLFDLLKPYLTNNGEYTIEANPNDISKQKLDIWEEVGFNRISLGIQSFQPNGLKFLTRDHTIEKSQESILLIKEKGWNYSLDLIYGWHQQTEQEWLDDLGYIDIFKPPHLSMYNLCYEANTPLFKVKKRLAIPDRADHDFKLYSLACNKLKKLGYDHYELASWSRTVSQRSRHNSNYWQDKSFVGIGAGAFGYISKDFNLSKKTNNLKARYSYSRKILEFIKSDAGDLKNINWEVTNSDSWAIEKISCGIRTEQGIHIKAITDELDMSFCPSDNLEQSFDSSISSYKNGFLKFDELEWFRENAWVHEVWDSFLYK